MVGSKIDGTAIAKSIREALKGEIGRVQEANPRFKPSLVIFQGASLYDVDMDSDTNNAQLAGGQIRVCFDVCLAAEAD